MSIRGVHLDLKGLPPTPARLLQLLELFAAAGFNAILIEWEDAFPWEADERFRSPTAYSAAVVERFHARARELGLQIIPLVQCLGHMETPLRHEKYAPLRELPDHCDGLNPLAPGARRLVERMIDDVLRRGGPLTHFHLGGDEAWTFGQHPDTKSFIAKHGKAALYLHHVEPLCEMLLSRGIRPILWHDMMLDWDAAALSRLAEKADLIIWSYRGRPDATVIERFAAVAGAAAVGARLWGACAFKGADSRGDGELPDVPARMSNAASWAQLAGRYDLRGMIATGWSRYSTHRPQCEPIDGALDALVSVGLTLRDGHPPTGNTVAKLLKTIGEWDRFQACRTALSQFGQATRDAWEYIILTHEQTALERLDSTRRGSGILPELGRIAREHLAAAESAAGDVRRALAGLTDDLWIDQFIAERLEPLREQLS